MTARLAHPPRADHLADDTVRALRTAAQLLAVASPTLDDLVDVLRAAGATARASAHLATTVLDQLKLIATEHDRSAVCATASTIATLRAALPHVIQVQAAYAAALLGAPQSPRALAPACGAQPFPASSDESRSS